jgi:hypothetical protein
MPVGVVAVHLAELPLPEVLVVAVVVVQTTTPETQIPAVVEALLLLQLAAPAAQAS